MTPELSISRCFEADRFPDGEKLIEQVRVRDESWKV